MTAQGILRTRGTPSDREGVTPFRALFRVLSPPGARAKLSILVFHRVHAQADALFPEEPDAARFAQVLGWLGEWFNVLPLDRAVRDLAAGRLPARAAAITFDDGYADNCTVALPILQSMRIPAAFFVATGFLDGGCMWNDAVIEAVRRCRHDHLDLVALQLGRHRLDDAAARRAAIEALLAQLKYRPAAQRGMLAEGIARRAGVEAPADLMMTSAQVKALAEAGMTLGAHTVSHPILKALPPAEARREIAEGRARLEQITGAPVTLFAYPNGRLGDDYLPEHAELVRALGFDAAVTTHWGAASAASDAMQLPRFTPWDRTRARFGARLAANLVRRTDA